MFETEDGITLWFEKMVIAIAVHLMFLMRFVYTDYGMPTVGRILRNTGENQHQFWFNLGFEITRWADLIILPIALTAFFVVWAYVDDLRNSILAGLFFGLFAGLYSGVGIGLLPMLYLVIVVSVISAILTKNDLAEILENGIGKGFGMVVGVFATTGCWFGLLPGVIFTMSAFACGVIAYAMASIIKAWLIIIFTPKRVNKKIKRA